MPLSGKQFCVNNALLILVMQMWKDSLLTENISLKQLFGIHAAAIFFLRCCLPKYFSLINIQNLIASYCLLSSLKVLSSVLVWIIIIIMILSKLVICSISPLLSVWVKFLQDSKLCRFSLTEDSLLISTRRKFWWKISDSSVRWDTLSAMLWIFTR